MECVPASDIYKKCPEAFKNIINFNKKELIIDISKVYYVKEYNISSFIFAIVDYYSGKLFEYPNPVIKKSKKNFPKYRIRPVFLAGV